MSYLPVTNIEEWNIQKYGLDLSCVYNYVPLNRGQEYFFIGLYPEHYLFLDNRLEGIRIIWEKNTYTLEEYERNTSNKSK